MCIDLYELIGVGVAGGVSQDVAGRFPATEHQTSGSPSSAPGVAGPEAADAAHAAPGEATPQAVPPADEEVLPPTLANLAKAPPCLCLTLWRPN